jgi:hypothetical protein
VVRRLVTPNSKFQIPSFGWNRNFPQKQNFYGNFLKHEAVVKKEIEDCFRALSPVRIPNSNSELLDGTVTFSKKEILYKNVRA